MIRGMRRRRARREVAAGQALVEMAMAAPILLLVILMLFEAGTFAFTLLTVEHAAQNGGRMAALPTTPSETVVKNHVVSRAALAPVSINTGNVTVTVTGCAISPCTFTTRTSGARVRVEVAYSYRPLVGMVFGNGTTFALQARTEYHVE